jgi:hypothetical protein
MEKFTSAFPSALNSKFFFQFSPPLGSAFMGQQVSVPGLSCCTERQDPKPSSNQPGRSIVSNGPVPDIATRFDSAVRSKDLMELVKLLSSNHKLGKDVAATQHPWSDQPQTIGALAAVHLAVLANDPDIRVRLRAAGAIPVLVQFLNPSNSRDRVHSAVVALSFITVDNDDNCREVYRCGGLPLLVPLIGAEPEGLRFASSSVCRNLYCKNRNARDEFVNLGGVKMMVNLLNYQPSRSSDTSYMDGIYETVSNLRDLLEADTTSNDSGGRLVKRAVKDGVASALSVIQTECQDDEIKQEASTLSSQISKFLQSSVGRSA